MRINNNTNNREYLGVLKIKSATGRTNTDIQGENESFTFYMKYITVKKKKVFRDFLNEGILAATLSESEMAFQEVQVV